MKWPLSSLALFLFAGFPLCAQPASAGASAAKLEVPENISEHAAPPQPLPFSHRTHVSRGLQCRQCHVNPEPGNQMTFPAVATCTGCHNSIAKDLAAIQKLVTPGVTWTHRKHLQAGIQCVNCHGQVGQLQQMAQTTAVTSMASCISCHQAHKARTVCQTCHAWPAADSVTSAR